MSATRVKCPRPEHAGSQVKLDGTYGSPAIGDSATSTRRVGGVSRPCSPNCCHARSRGRTPASTVSEQREGPKAPRHYQFVARGIAEVLQAVGAGESYMRVSRVTRDRARRFSVDATTGELRESDHGQLLADWVEVFAPVVFDAHRPTEWPVEGSLLLDHLPFRVRALDRDGRRMPAGRVAFDVFCGVGFYAGRPRLWWEIPPAAPTCRSPPRRSSRSPAPSSRRSTRGATRSKPRASEQAAHVAAAPRQRRRRPRGLHQSHTRSPGGQWRSPERAPTHHRRSSQHAESELITAQRDARGGPP